MLRRWRQSFGSLHELLCAVEASWVYKKKPLDADTVLKDFDLDLGPSNPGPKEPLLLGKKEDAIVVSQCNDSKNKFVTALEISQESDGKMVLYSGHADGTLNKWCLKENRQLWSKQIYVDGTKDFEHFSYGVGVCLQGIAGVAGLVIRNTGKKHLLYTWSDAPDGYPEKTFEISGPAKVKCWNGEDGSYVTSYVCDVGNAHGGENAANPSIATLVFCRLLSADKNKWFDSMVVGLHCMCGAIDWGGEYQDFVLEQAQAVGEGNILPFQLSTGNTMDTWREHTGMIRAMAVVPDRFMLSYSIRYGHGAADACCYTDPKS